MGKWTSPLLLIKIKKNKQMKKNGKNIFLSVGKKVINNFRDFIYPPLCVLCGNPLTEDNNWFCAECKEKLEKNRSERDACPRCSHNLKIEKCTCNIVWDHYFETVFSLFDFDETVQHIAHQIKYKGKKSLGYHMGSYYASTIPNSFFDNIEGILPVPLHFIRKMKRGYNQAEFFARGIINGIEHNLPYFNNVLIRVKNTKTQTKLDKEERQKNLSNAFTVNSKNSGYINGKRLILIDDVVTTGATTDLCTKVLIDAGARVVRVISLART